MLALFEMLAEKTIPMPPRAEPSIVARGVELLRSMINEERRREEARRRKEESCVCFSLGSAPGDESRATQHHPRSAPSSGGVRWGRKSASYAPPPPPPPAPSKKRPPDLHAPVLSFSARLLKYVNERFDGKGPTVYRRAGIDRRLYSKIISDNESGVSKPTALQLAFGLNLTLEETKEFIGAAGFLLSPTLPYDRAFIYCFENDIRNLLDVNEILEGAELPCLTIRY